ncbi:transporter substrate-binding domain-containing protein [Vibrio cholerae]|nr:transporter substrate-binding domain-containing protein [Vibrio cholerae]EJR3664094.1 transporter substrate-binding domain-containing protein [Vibrio cholerae]
MKILIFLVIAFYHLSASSKTIIIAGDEWYPMNGSPEMENPGFMIEVARFALKEKGLSLEYRIMPWERAIQSARDNSINCIVGAGESDAPGFIFGKEPYGLYQASFYKNRSDSFQYVDLASLSNKKVGTILGYYYDSEVDEWLDKNGISLTGNDALEKNIRKLLAQRIDLVIESTVVMGSKLKEMNLTDSIVSAGLLGESFLYIACGPNNPDSKDIILALDNGINLLRKNGELDKILSKYGVEDWE